MVSRHVPEFAAGYDIVPYDIRQAYLDMFRSLCDTDSPVCVLLTDGKFGSAFFEHRYLSELLGIPLVEGSDLYVGYDGRVYARTLDQDIPVDLIYRRVEDLDMFVRACATPTSTTKSSSSTAWVPAPPTTSWSSCGPPK